MGQITCKEIESWLSNNQFRVLKNIKYMTFYHRGSLVVGVPTPEAKITSKRRNSLGIDSRYISYFEELCLIPGVKSERNKHCQVDDRLWPISAFSRYFGKIHNVKNQKVPKKQIGAGIGFQFESELALSIFISKVEVLTRTEEPLVDIDSSSEARRWSKRELVARFRSESLHSFKAYENLNRILSSDPHGKWIGSRRRKSYRATLWFGIEDGTKDILPFGIRIQGEIEINIEMLFNRVNEGHVPKSVVEDYLETLRSNSFLKEADFGRKRIKFPCSTLDEESALATFCQNVRLFLDHRANYSKRHLKIGIPYTRKEINNALGGNIRSYLPVNGEKVVCICLNPDKNPKAPWVILVGNGVDIKANAETLINQQVESLPCFIKKGSNSWVYYANVKVATYSSDIEIIEKLSAEAGRTDVTMVIWLEDADLNSSTLLPEELTESEKFSEGSQKSVIVNRYERDNKARHICLSIHGYECKACNINLESIYGPIAKQFIHVHHRTPISEVGPKYEVDPVVDLVPLCPNCHSIVHRKNPPLTVEQLRELLKSRKRS